MCLEASGAGAMEISNMSFHGCTFRVQECSGCLLSDLDLMYPTYDPTWQRGISKYMPVATTLSGVNGTLTRMRLTHSNNYGVLVLGDRHIVTDVLIESTCWLGSLDFTPIKIGFTQPGYPKIDIEDDKQGEEEATVGEGVEKEGRRRHSNVDDGKCGPTCTCSSVAFPPMSGWVCEASGGGRSCCCDGQDPLCADNGTAYYPKCSSEEGKRICPGNTGGCGNTFTAPPTHAHEGTRIDDDNRDADPRTGHHHHQARQLTALATHHRRVRRRLMVGGTGNTIDRVTVRGFGNSGIAT